MKSEDKFILWSVTIIIIILAVVVFIRETQPYYPDPCSIYTNSTQDDYYTLKTYDSKRICIERANYPLWFEMDANITFKCKRKEGCEVVRK